MEATVVAGIWKLKVRVTTVCPLTGIGLDALADGEELTLRFQSRCSLAPVMLMLVLYVLSITTVSVAGEPVLKPLMVAP